MINEPEETQLDRMLSRIETFLALIGFEQSSWLSFALSWTSFLVVGVVVPLVVLFVGDCTDCEEYQRKNFEVEIVAFQACLAAVSLLCLSHNLRKYGLRRFLFVDRYSGRLMSLHERYIKQVSESFRLLALWGSTCFFLKTIREIIRLSHVNHESWWPSFAVSVALIISWTYVSTIVQVVGIIICLHAATRISHRAQNIVSLASRWHALATCTTSDASPLRSYASAGSLEPANHLNSLHFNSSESDLESLEFNVVPTNSQLASYMSSHHKRQAFVMYLQTNPGGITIFGWVVDRSLVNTIFFLELTRWLHSWQDHIMMHIVNMYQRAGIVCHLLVENHFV
ncbi:uncharacterized protein LOC114729374 isoform X2 [Neltuma alba]|uniref:uncharacterized protein LOC114729374 isoform X2 n=1 Tax=Neltuma alba TaxID=207710 RepID=UPI0010A2EB4A|nr:uncharacterized protein LOC114729374 isoform X2 [Prosopis alba]